MESSSQKTDLYSVKDLKLQAFLRTLYPKSFFGINRSDNKVNFLFENSEKITKAIERYSKGEEFTFSPLSMAHYLDEGKSLIFGDYKT